MPPPGEIGSTGRVSTATGGYPRLPPQPAPRPITRVTPDAMVDGFEPVRPPAIVPAPRNATARELRVSDLTAVLPSLSRERAMQILPHLNRAMQEANINTPRRQAAFLAQLATESGEFKDFTENGNDSRYRGRGPIQLTGRRNYAAAGRALGVDLVNDPDRAATDLSVGFRTAAWFWSANNVNRHADRGDVLAVSRTVNFGRATTSEIPNHLDRRQRYYRAALRLLS